MKTIIASILVLGTLLSGCATDKSVWRKASSENLHGSYSEYLKEYPDGTHVTEARAAIERIQWEAARSANNYESYHEYLLAYPNGRYADEARVDAENAFWRLTESSTSIDVEKTIQAYEAYLQKYPKGNFAHEARRNIDDLAWGRATYADDRNAYESYVGRFPEGAHTDEARARIELIVWTVAEADGHYVSLYETYNAYYPNGKYARENSDVLAFALAEKDGSVASFQDYLSRFPSGRFAVRAKHNVELLTAGLPRQIPKITARSAKAVRNWCFRDGEEDATGSGIHGRLSVAHSLSRQEGQDGVRLPNGRRGDTFRSGRRRYRFPKDEELWPRSGGSPMECCSDGCVD